MGMTSPMCIRDYEAFHLSHNRGASNLRFIAVVAQVECLAGTYFAPFTNAGFGSINGPTSYRSSWFHKAWHAPAVNAIISHTKTVANESATLLSLSWKSATKPLATVSKKKIRVRTKALMGERRLK